MERVLNALGIGIIASKYVVVAMLIGTTITTCTTV
jgi:hypothetical protein